jgi:hypothetical protein
MPKGVVWPQPGARRAPVVIDLREATDWSPRLLTRVARADVPLLSTERAVVWERLADVAALLAIPTTSREGLAFRPSDIDRRDGAIRSYAGAYKGRVYLVDGTSLRVGDVLVPDDPSRPAVLIDGRHEGLAFTATFAALRPSGVMDGLVLWALLSSRAGMDARTDVSMSNAVLGVRKTSRQALLGLIVPMRPPEWWRARRSELQALHAAAGVVPTPPARSGWAVVDLAHMSSWRPMDALQPPTPTVTGSPLGELCDFLRRGSVTRRVTAEMPAPGWLPVATVTAINRGASPRRWVAPASAGTAVGQSGDVVVGLIGHWSTAAVLIADCGIDHDVALLRLTNVALRDRVIHYLNSAKGQAARRELIPTGTIPHLSLAALKEIRIPPFSQHDELDQPSRAVLPVWPPSTSPFGRTGDTDGAGIAEALQRLLWP